MLSSLATRCAASATTQRFMRPTPAAEASYATHSPERCASRRHRSGAASPPWWRRASPTICAISSVQSTAASTSGMPRTGFRQMRSRPSRSGLIPGFAGTVHHVDDFADPRPAALQWRAIESADRLFVVSRLWRDWLAHEYSREAVLVGNGVDSTRFSPMADATDAALRPRLSLAPGGKVFLAIGGIEQRKNAIGLLEAFRIVHAQYPSSCIIIAGGASLLDHDAYLTRFAAALEASGLPDGSVIRTGPLPQALMPALYRAAAALVFPSIKEGFGLVVLEAMACGVPVVTSRIAPFTEYLGDGV